MPDPARGGNFVAQPEGYRAFVPKPLPPAPPIAWNTALQDLQSSASVAIGRLDGITRLLPNPDMFLYTYVRKEAVLSSQIEGTQSSLSDLLLFEDAKVPAVPTSDVEEVSRHVRALNHGMARLRELPLSMRLLREVHGELLAGGRGGDKTPGELRRSQNWIGGTGPSNAVFVPPPVHALPDLLANLERFLHDEPERTPSLVKAGLAHAQFETIHPFLDGNGRVGRILITLTLLAEKVLSTPLLYMSLHFKDQRDEYYARLQRVRTHGEWEEWLGFFLRGVRVVADLACAMIEKLTTLFAADRQRIESTGTRAVANALREFDHAKDHVVVSVPAASIALGLSQPTVNAAVKLLEGLGIVHEATGKARDRRYLYGAYLSTLNET